MRLLPIALLILASSSGSVLAQADGAVATATAAPVAEPPPAASDGDEPIVVEGELPKDKRRVCENRVQTGSIMPKRVCRTVAQAEEERQAALELTERIKREREARTLTQELR